jgi:hypothetical protein
VYKNFLFFLLHKKERMKSWTIAILIGAFIIIVLVFIVLAYKKKDKKEPFVYVPRSFYFENEYGNNGWGYDLPNPKVPLTDVLSDDQFMSRPQLQSYQEPRIPPIQFSSEIRGPMPPEYMMAVPKNPANDSPELIDFASYMGKVETVPEELAQMNQGEIKMDVHEQPTHKIPSKFQMPPPRYPAGAFTGNEIPTVSPYGQEKFGQEKWWKGKEGYASASSREEYTSIPSRKNMSNTSPLEYNDPSEILPGEDMASIKFGKLASDPNTYIYDRLIYANQKRRNLYGADWIRGDLPIVPINHTDGESSWFQPSIKPHLDLRKSALRYIGPEYDTIVDAESLMVNSKFEERAPKVIAYQ